MAEQLREGVKLRIAVLDALRDGPRSYGDLIMEIGDKISPETARSWSWVKGKNKSIVSKIMSGRNRRLRSLLRDLVERGHQGIRVLDDGRYALSGAFNCRVQCKRCGYVSYRRQLPRELRSATGDGQPRCHKCRTRRCITIELL